MKDIKLYGTATVGTKGQVVIPADARNECSITPGDRLYVIGLSHHYHAIGLIKEDYLREMISQMAEKTDLLKSFLTIDSEEK